MEYVVMVIVVMFILALVLMIACAVNIVVWMLFGDMIKHHRKIRRSRK